MKELRERIEKEVAKEAERKERDDRSRQRFLEGVKSQFRGKLSRFLKMPVDADVDFVLTSAPWQTVSKWWLVTHIEGIKFMGLFECDQLSPELYVESLDGSVSPLNKLCDLSRFFPPKDSTRL